MDLSKNSKEPYRSKITSPISWTLIPLIIGYSLEHFFPSAAPSHLITLLGASGLLAFSCAWIINRHQFLALRALGVLSLTLTSWQYAHYRLHHEGYTENFPAREVTLFIKIDHVKDLRDKHHRYSGYGTIKSEPNTFNKIEEHKLFFLLSSETKLEPTYIIQAKGVLRKHTQSGSGFDDYLQKKGITLKLTQGKVLSLVKEASLFTRFTSMLRSKLETILERNFIESEAGPLTSIYSGMLLGNKSTLDEDQKIAFQKTGSLHLFAISGLHVGIIAATLAYILSLLRLSTLLQAFLGLGLLLAYVLITGAAPSSIRAFIMVAFYWGASAVSRKRCPFSALANSALFVLLYSPAQLWNIGFQLSYIVVASILLYGLPLSETSFRFVEKTLTWPAWIKKFIHFLLSLLWVSLAANLASLPLSLMYFNNYAPGAIFLSMILVPLASIIVSLGCTSLIAGACFIPLLPKCINSVAVLFVSLMEYTIFGSLKLSWLFQTRTLIHPSVTALVLISLLSFCFYFHQKNKLDSKTFYILPAVTIPFLLAILSS